MNVFSIPVQKVVWTLSQRGLADTTFRTCVNMVIFYSPLLANTRDISYFGFGSLYAAADIGTICNNCYMNEWGRQFLYHFTQECFAFTID